MDDVHGMADMEVPRPDKKISDINKSDIVTADFGKNFISSK